MDKKLIFFQAVGVVAFIIGGIITRDKVIDGLEHLDEKFNSPEPNDQISV